MLIKVLGPAGSEIAIVRSPLKQSAKSTLRYYSGIIAGQDTHTYELIKKSRNALFTRKETVSGNPVITFAIPYEAVVDNGSYGTVCVAV